MKLQIIFLTLIVILLFLLLSEVNAISNQENLIIKDEEKRGSPIYVSPSDHSPSATVKRGLYSIGDDNRYHTIKGTGYGPGHPSKYGPLSGYDQPTNYGPSSYGPSGYGGASTGHGNEVSPHHQHNGLALKGLLIPLAGIALLGAAAALSTNPLLLQLGVVNGRRRRDLSSFKKTRRNRGST